MKRNQKSAFMRCLFVATAFCGLSACDSIKNADWPHVYGPNEVPKDVANAPRAVESAPAPPKDTPFPRLGDVPMKPKDFTPQAQIDKTKADMEADRVEAQTIRQQVDMPASAPTQQQ